MAHKVYDDLKAIYDNDPNLKPYWDEESKVMHRIFPAIARRIRNSYRITGGLGVGGSGVVLTVEDRNLSVQRALKVARPSMGKEVLLARILLSETRALLRLSHQNLIHIFYQGRVPDEDREYPYYIMEYVPDVKDADKFLAKPGRTDKDVLKVLKGTVAAVEYLHAQQTVHMDLKPGNVLVAPDATPVLSDLGFAKQIRDDRGKTLIGGTEGYIHPDARKLATTPATDPNRLRGEAPRLEVRAVWDLYSLGKTFLKLLEVLERSNAKILSPYTKRYLRLLACRMLDGHNSESERAAGLTTAALAEIKYKDIVQVRVDLEKLTGEYNLEARIPELSCQLQDTIQVSPLAVTPFTARVKAVASDPAMVRLNNVTQLGLLNLVYPTANHSRFEHCLGTFSMMCRYLVALYNDPFNPLFKQVMDEKDLRATLLVALLHDVGQFPMAHDVEEADSSIEHEDITISVLTNKESSLVRLIEGQDREECWDVESERLVSILRADPAEKRGTLKDRIIKSLIDGPIDADKIDYLMRDSARLGLTYGGVIDIERLLRCLTIVFKQEAEQTHAALGIHEKGKIPAESVAFARYAMFGQVYWHHAYRAVKAMLHRLIWEALSSQKDDDQRSRLRSEFRRFVSSVPTPEAQQLVFPTDAPATGLVCIEGASQIQYADLSVLQWFNDRIRDTSTASGDPTSPALSEPASGSARELLALLKSRRFFKRILVLALDKTTDKKLWEDLVSFQSRSRRSWRKKRRLQVEFQKEVLDRVEKPVEEPIHTAVLTPDARNEFIKAARERVLVLVDVPPDGGRSDLELEYLIEEDRRRYKIDQMKTGSLGHSQVWTVLQDKFTESIGKVRVFCHPDYHEFLSAYMPRERLRDALRAALKTTDKD